MMSHLNLNNPIDLLFVIVVITILCVAAFFLVLVVHKSAPQKKTKRMKTRFFETIEEYGEFDVIYCTITKVMYTISTDCYNSGTLTLLVNADGTPMLYKPEDYPTKTH